MTSPLVKLLQSFGIKCHFYADESLLYVLFDIDDADAAVWKVEKVVAVIRHWIATNSLSK